MQNQFDGVDAPVYDAEGNPLEGTGYLAELWGGATSNSLAPALVIDKSNRRDIIPFRTGGYFFSIEGRLSVMGVLPSGFAWLEVRAWDASLGGRYEEVRALGIGGYGESPLLYTQGGNPYDNRSLPPPLIGLQSFSLRPIIPEPSTGAMLSLGAGMLWWARHRRE